MELLSLDWTGLVLVFFVIYGIYAPCLLILLERQYSMAERCCAMLACLLLSWLGYWLSKRRLKYGFF